VPQGIVKPSNQIIAAGEPLIVEMEVGANATVAKMLPGRVVIFDTTDQTVLEASAKADNAVGFIEVKPNKTKTDVPSKGDQIPVVVGECLAVLTLVASENVTRGDNLVCANDGKLAKQAVGVMGAQGTVVAQAWESSNVTADAEILVLWRRGAEPATVS
jgi:hypothetical protein